MMSGFGPVVTKDEKIFTIRSQYALAPTVLSTSLGKTLFVWRFILNENIWSD